MRKRITAVITVVISLFGLLSVTGCNMCSATRQNTSDTKKVTESLLENQRTPTDIDYSLERYNLTKRAYWVNGQREKAITVPCGVDRPIGYIVLITDSGAILGTYTVDGKVSSLNSYLSPDSTYYAADVSSWLADIDGSYGTNADGVFWFTVDGNYMEWNGKYLYSDIPFIVDEPVLKINGKE